MPQRRGKRSKSGACARRLRGIFPLRSNGFADDDPSADPPIHNWRVYWLPYLRRFVRRFAKKTALRSRRPSTTRTTRMPSRSGSGV